MALEIYSDAQAPSLKTKKVLVTADTQENSTEPPKTELAPEQITLTSNNGPKAELTPKELTLTQSDNSPSFVKMGVVGDEKLPCIVMKNSMGVLKMHHDESGNACITATGTKPEDTSQKIIFDAIAGAEVKDKINIESKSGGGMFFNDLSEALTFTTRPDQIERHFNISVPRTKDDQIENLYRWSKTFDISNFSDGMLCIKNFKANTNGTSGYLSLACELEDDIFVNCETAANTVTLYQYNDGGVAMNVQIITRNRRYEGSSADEVYFTVEASIKGPGTTENDCNFDFSISYSGFEVDATLQAKYIEPANLELSENGIFPIDGERVALGEKESPFSELHAGMISSRLDDFSVSDNQTIELPDEEIAEFELIYESGIVYYGPGLLLPGPFSVFSSIIVGSRVWELTKVNGEEVKNGEDNFTITTNKENGLSLEITPPKTFRGYSNYINVSTILGQDFDLLITEPATYDGRLETYYKKYGCYFLQYDVEYDINTDTKTSETLGKEKQKKIKIKNIDRGQSDNTSVKYTAETRIGNMNTAFSNIFNAPASETEIKDIVLVGNSTVTITIKGKIVFKWPKTLTSAYTELTKKVIKNAPSLFVGEQTIGETSLLALSPSVIVTGLGFDDAYSHVGWKIGTEEDENNKILYHNIVPSAPNLLSIGNKTNGLKSLFFSDKGGKSYELSFVTAENGNICIQIVRRNSDGDIEKTGSLYPLSS